MKFKKEDFNSFKAIIKSLEGRKHFIFHEIVQPTYTSVTKRSLQH